MTRNVQNCTAEQSLSKEVGFELDPVIRLERKNSLDDYFKMSSAF